MDSKEKVSALIAKARVAQKQFESFNQEQVDACVKAIARVIYENAEMFAKMAVEETRMGVYEDKIKKNQGKAKAIWNNLKTKKSVGLIETNEETGISIFARPVGVVGAITPCTNPIVTPMCNAMFAFKGRNAVIIAPHPRAKKCTAEIKRLFDEALAKVGAPADLFQYIEDCQVEDSAELMKSVDVVVATGGMGMVRAAYSSGKPAYGVGAGNVQGIIDDDVDIAVAASRMIASRKFDNGIICSGTQTIIAPAKKYDEIIAEFVKQGCFFVNDPADREKFVNAIFPGGVMNKNLVGQSTAKVAEAAGVAVPEGTKVIIIEADGHGKDFLLSKEKMCPVMSSYKYDTFEEAVAIAKDNLDFEGRGHSVDLQSNNEAHLLYAGEHLEVARILINQECATQNGGAFTNFLTPTTTLGCCSWGNNSISENFDYRFLINYIRVARRVERYTPTDEEMWG